MDPLIEEILHQVNKVMIDRLDYNDHGIVHAKIVAENALRLLELIPETPNIIKEGIGNMEDVRFALKLAAYLHDIGNAVHRENHEIFSIILAQPIALRILRQRYDEAKAWKLWTIIAECILCHMGNYEATSVEAGILAVADGCDMTKGRARIAFQHGARDIHEYSAMAIDKVEIMPGKEKPIEIHVYMENPAGIFQVEEILLKKLRKSSIRKFVKVVAYVGKERNEYVIE